MNLLTPSSHPVTLIAPLMPLSSSVRLGTLQNITVRPMALILVNRFFYAYRKGAGKIRAFTSSFMVGYFRGAATVMAAFQPLILSHRPELGTFVGGYFKFITGNAMNSASMGKYAQNPQIKSVSLFNVFLHRQLIAPNVSAHRVECIKRHRHDCVVKFLGWGF